MRDAEEEVKSYSWVPERKRDSEEIVCACVIMRVCERVCEIM